MKSRALKTRFWEHIKQTPGCWPWQGSFTKAGYGQIGAGGREGKHLYAHRLSWEFANGRELRPGEVIRHSCNHPWCVNPAHLNVGTHADNVADKVNRGRHPHGEAHHSAKLSDSDIARIRTFRGYGAMQTDIARLYGVHQSTISLVLNGKRRSVIS